MSFSTTVKAHSNGKDGRVLTFIDICSGAGGLASGLEQAGFRPLLLLDKLDVACRTLQMNRPGWNVLKSDLRDFDPVDHAFTYDVDLLSAGLPRVRAAAAMRRNQGDDFELEVLKATVMLVHAIQPRSLLIENVSELATKAAYQPIRTFVEEELDHLGYRALWLVLNAADFRVPQDRRQGVLVAFKAGLLSRFRGPEPGASSTRVTVGEALYWSMASRGWSAAADWAAQADQLAPTLVGGSMDRGGADLGPSGTKRAWARMGVFGGSLADELPGPDFDWDPDRGRDGMVRLTVEQAALLQGFPSSWQFAGRKTMRYRQIGHATPPPVARALGAAVHRTLTGG